MTLLGKIKSFYENTKPDFIRFGVVALMFVSIIEIVGVESRQAQQVAFMLFMVVLFSVLLKNIWITAFLLWSVFLYSFFKFASGGVYISNLLLGTILFFITKASFSRKTVDYFINGFLWFVCLNLFYAAIQASGFDFIFSHKDSLISTGLPYYTQNTLPNGFMGHKSGMGMLLALAVPILATRGSKMAWAGTVGLFFPLYLATTSLCFVMGIFGLIFVLFFRIPRKIWAALVCLLVVSGVFYCQKVDSPGTERLKHWHSALRHWSIHPVTGYGLDSYRNVTPSKPFRFMHTDRKITEVKAQDGNTYNNVHVIEYLDNPHNLYVSLLFEWGLPGLIIFCGFFFDKFMAFQYSVKDPNTIALFGFILCFLGLSVGHFPIFLARFATIIVPAIALYELLTDG